MIGVFFLALYAFLAFILYKLFSILAANRYHAARAKELGCEDAVDFHDNGLLGWANLVKPLKAQREMRLPDLVIDSFRESSEIHGRDVTTFCIRFMGTVCYNTIDPRNVQAVLGTKFKDFGLGETRIAAFKPLLGNGIFSSDGQQWEHSRALLRPQFARDQVGDLDLEERHLQNLFRAIPIKDDGWSLIIDLQPLFFRLTLDSATEFLFGESADSQLAALPGYTRPKTAALNESNFAEAFDKAQYILGEITLWGDFYWLAFTKEFYKACNQCHEFIDHYVHKALTKNSPYGNDAKEGQKEKYVFLKVLASNTRDPLELRYQLLSILLAGRDTTASTLGWLFFVLIQYPDAQQKLREVILEHFGSYEDPQNLSFSGLKSCHYLQHSIAEILRLYPVVPLNSRRALADTTLPYGGGPDGNSPVYVRRGEEVIYGVHIMHRSKKVWGADADEYRPERWVRRKSGWEYLPFNGGARICLGQQFALTNVAYMTVRMLQRFDKLEGFGIPRKGERVKHGLTLTSNPGEGVKVRMRVRPTP